MPVGSLLLAALAALVGGAINSIAGGGTLVFNIQWADHKHRRRTERGAGSASHN